MRPASLRKVLLTLALASYGACHNFSDTVTAGPGNGGGSGSSSPGAMTFAGQAGAFDDSYGGRTGSPPEGAAGNTGTAGTDQLRGGDSGAANVGDGGGPGIGDRGAAGFGEDGGAAGFYGTTEEVVVPACVLGTGLPPPGFTSAHGVAATNQTSSFFELYATQPANNILLTSWQTDTPYPGAWASWLCFDRVLHPERVAAATLSNNTPEVYATGATDSLYVRRWTSVGWSAWGTLGLPSTESTVTDVAAVGLPSTEVFVYVVDGGKVYVRHRLSTDPYSPYGPWRLVGNPNARLLSVAMRTDGVQEVFVVTKSGTVLHSVQASAEPDSAFGGFSEFGNGSVFIDIEAGAAADQTLVLYALDSTGALWLRSSDGSTWSEWDHPVIAGAIPPFTVITVGSSPNRAPSVFGVNAAGGVYESIAGDSFRVLPVQ